MVGSKTTNYSNSILDPWITANYQYKVAILNVKDAGSVAGSDYGTFSVQLRRVDLRWYIHAANTPYSKSGDTDLRPHIVEQWNNLTLDP